MSSDLEAEDWEGEDLILGIEAREAGTIAFHAWLKYRFIAISQLALGSLGVGLAVMGSLAIGILAFLAVGVLEVFRRRAQSEFERVDTLAEELAAVADASNHPPRHPTT